MYQRLHWYVIIYLICVIFNDGNFWWILLIMAVLGLILHYCFRFTNLFITSLILFAFFAFFQIPSLDISKSLNTASSTLQGKIVSMVEEQSQFLRFTLETSDENLVQVYLYPSTDQFSSNLDMFRTGATCHLTGQFDTITPKRNPGQFDYKHYLASQGIHYQFVMEPIYNNECEGQSFLQNVYDTRRQHLSQMKEQLSSDTFSWYAALLFGDRQYLDDEIVALFQNWNLSHLLAISGLHVGFIIAITYFLLLFLFRMTLERAQLLIGCFLILYPLMAGGAASVWRASLLAVVLIAIHKSSVKLAITDSLSIVFLLMVFVHPYSIYSLAFQFSFMVTFAIILSRKVISGSLSYTWIVIRISLVSMLVILPFQLLHFYQFQPLSVLLNLIIIPYFTLIVMPFLIVIFSLSFFLPSVLSIADRLFLDMHDSVIENIYKMNDWLSVPWVTGEFPSEFIIPYYCLMYVMFYFWEKKQLVRSFFFSAALVTLLVMITIKPYLSKFGYVTMLDIGQGDAIVVELPYRKGVIIIDAAGTMSADFSSPSTKNYDQIIDPFLKSKGITEIDAIILSHEDHDHIGSVSGILKHYNVNAVITSPFFDQSQLVEWKGMSRADFITFKSGDQFYIDKQLFQVISPVFDMSDPNENSLVIKTVFGKDTWLFTGDIGESGEAALAKQFPGEEVDVLKVAHHGSKTSTSENYLDTIQPKLALISVGVNNRYGHPDQEVVDRLLKNGIKILRTDINGAIIYKFSSNSGTVSTYLP
ncbi:DNA internalization-related competence protein ComEC/Rec2 [Gracilibacillus salinarum]|uniref:DNA internalization-related competence protein ComEC/Rec2 n=1 Tax=Gracilibacillus salinarum TaxID=2932255 RepID=A0ABY4GP71_9BACI|nr:DNA internalization-related competence protein ComEC/Rec2 [Gracilibacillus salinarum]UOQ86064.1 DNA internalization-related competence protein ComEC/Rec2 [Gracilibacillus salinarum]